MATRYIKTESNGAITFTPVDALDVNADGKIDTKDAIAVVAGIPKPPPVTPPPPVEPPPVINVGGTTYEARPDGDFQAMADKAGAGDTVVYRGGDYRKASGGQNYEACLSLAKNGVTHKAATGERPVFYGTNKTYAIVVGWIKYDGTKYGVHDVVVDGLNATESPWDGLKVVESSNVNIRNVSAFANNFGSTNGFKAGINVESTCSNVTIERCRAYDSGEGIVIGDDQAGVENPTSVVGISIRDCFVYGNSRTANPGNSSGIELWFCDGAIITGNVCYDGVDANINGQGNTRCRVIGNAFLNAWQPGGNQEGLKLCVRGGGCNVIANNIVASNGNCGYDAAGGVGDICIGNTFYGNGSWGILAEGRETVLFNNFVSGNSVRLTDNAYPEQDGAGWSLISAYNVYGSGPIKSTANDTLALPSGTLTTQPVSLSGISLTRSDARQVNHPLQAFGTDSIEEARARVLAAYKPGTAIPGVTLAEVASRVNANIPSVMASLDAAIIAADGSTDFQAKQSKSRYLLLKARLSSYDLSGIPDTGVVGAVK